MKTILSKLTVLTLVLTLAATTAATIPTVEDDGVQVINDGPHNEGFKVP